MIVALLTVVRTRQYARVNQTNTNASAIFLGYDLERLTPAIVLIVQSEVDSLSGKQQRSEGSME